MNVLTSQWTDEEILNAWQPWHETTGDAAVFQFAHAHHLIRRAGFGANTQRIEQLAELGLAEAVKSLMAPPDAASFDAEADAMIRTSLVLGSTDHLADWWLYRMLNDPFAVREKATLFWHGHFCTGRDKVPDARLLLTQNDLLREHALGSFAQMVKRVSRDAAMLIYLDSTENQKTRPNENYAREIMELFCLGIGNYSERDIKELARCFTGWEVRRQRFRFSPSAHDTDEKEILGSRGNMDGDDAIDVVLQQPAASKHIARKLVSFYLTDDEVPEPVIESLAQVLLANQWEMGPTLAMLFSSQAFYSRHAVHRQVAGPLAWTLSWLKTLDVTGDLNVLRNDLELMGQVPLEPPNVKGWPGGSTWIDPSRMAARIAWVSRLSNNNLEPSNGLASWLSSQGMKDPASMVQWLEESLIGRPVSQRRKAALVAAVTSKSSLPDAFRAGVRLAGIMPEAHVF